MPYQLEPYQILGSLLKDLSNVPISGAVWYIAHDLGDGLEYRFPAGALANREYITADILLDGDELGVFMLTLAEGESDAVFELYYGVLNQCQARMAVPLEAVSQNRWQYPRRAAWLKPMCGGQRVDLSRVDRMTISVLRKGDAPVKWCMTPVQAVEIEPEQIVHPMLPKGPLMDCFGQSTLRNWQSKTHSEEELVARLQTQLESAEKAVWPEGYSRWGGWNDIRFEATGFFHTHHDGKRWWLVDPDGYVFWSAGMDCVGLNISSACDGLLDVLEWIPNAEGKFEDAIETRHFGKEFINYLKANFLRVFEPKEYYSCWSKIVLSQLRQFGFNTIANWSDWQIAKENGFPYVRPLDYQSPKTKCIFRDMPDVFSTDFEEDARIFADQLTQTRDDPAFIGYFLMNEPTWGFAKDCAAKGMLYNTASCASRDELCRWLTSKYGNESALCESWGVNLTFDDIAHGQWTHPLNLRANQDLEDFSSILVEKLFRTLTEACRKVDPNHLNLGARYYTVPPPWASAGMRCFDVFSMNCYNDHVPEERVEEIVKLLGIPVMIGEWHFGAMDVGLPGSGIGRVKDQLSRGQAYRYYVENAAVQAGCVGTHYFTLYDESCLGRFDGENWNIGFVDVCNRPYAPLVDAARETHERLYRVATGEIEPFSNAPEYLPKLFL